MTVNDLEYPKFSEFDYWFYGLSPDTFAVYEITSDGREFHHIGTWYDYQGTFLTASCESDVVHQKQIELEFPKFKLRPEYAVFRGITDVSSNYEAYTTLLFGCAMIRFWSNNLQNNKSADPDSCLSRFQAIDKWLRSTDFFAAPASTIYHEAYAGGLVEHTLKVVANIQEFKNISKFRHVKYEDAVLVALVHDWCKIGLYQSFKKNVKDESGNWVQVDAYKRADSDCLLPFGHGVQSMYTAMSMFKLSTSECLAIRWHMGMFNVASNEINDYETAAENHPLVLMLQFADHLSCSKF